MGSKACSDYMQEIKDALLGALNWQILDVCFVTETRALICTQGIWGKTELHYLVTQIAYKIQKCSCLGWHIMSRWVQCI